MENYINYSMIRELFQKNYVGFLITCVLTVLVTILYRKFSKKAYKLPPGPVGLPILGYLPFLGQEPYKDLDELKKRYGNVFGLHLGLSYVVILGDYEAVKDAFSKTTTTDRPEKLFNILPDEAGFSSVNGLEWVEQRNFCMKSLGQLGVGKNNWESIIQILLTKNNGGLYHYLFGCDWFKFNGTSIKLEPITSKKTEVQGFVELVSSFNGQPMEFCHLLTSSVINNISSFVFGTRFPLNHPDRKILDTVLEDIMLSLNQTCILNFFPIIRDVYIALGLGNIGKQQCTMKKFNQFVRNEIRKMKQSYRNGEHANFIADYLREMDSRRDKSGHFFTDKNLAGNVQALYVGGSETTNTSIQWLLLIMANFPQIQEKVQKEIDDVFDKNEQIQWSDRMKLPYTMSVIMEGQRWQTVAPINTARIATEDMKIQGYEIPKGTAIIANNWGLHHDSRYWKNPETFDPERFLTNDGKEIIKKPQSYVPFSFGKRNCPGETIAMMEILLYFATIMQKFTVIAPHNTKVNMTGTLGLVYLPPAQNLSFVPRI